MARSGSRGSGPARRVPASQSAGSAGNVPGSARSRYAPRAAPGSGRRTGGCRSRTPGAGCRRAAGRAGRPASNCAGSRLAAPIHSVTSAPAGRSTPPTVQAVVARRLPSWFDDSKRRNSSTAMSRCGLQRRGVVPVAGQLRQQLVLGIGPFLQRDQRVADQVGRGLVAGVQDEDAVVQQLGLGQAGAVGSVGVGLALDQSGQHIVLRVARVAPALGDQHSQVVQKLGHAAIAQRLLLRSSAPAPARRGSPATSHAAARGRHAARRAGCR